MLTIPAQSSIFFLSSLTSCNMHKVLINWSSRYTWFLFYWLMWLIRTKQRTWERCLVHFFTLCCSWMNYIWCC